MQAYSLTVNKFLEHAAKWSGGQEIVSAHAGLPACRIGYAAALERSNRLSGALRGLGLEFGDRIATLAWNTQHHFEMYFAIMGGGYVCHTLNPRLTAIQLAAMVNEAENRVIAVAIDLLPLVAELVQLCPCLEHVVVMDGELPAEMPSQLAAQPSTTASAARIWQFETLLQEFGSAITWGDFPEDSAAGLCYTSGTTGQPKGVVYTHRSNYLHTLRALQADAMAVTARDVLLAAVPMFHANGWGLPFIAPAVGARLVLPGRDTDGASLARLMRDEGVTVAVGVQTVWLGVVEHLEATGGELPNLQRVVIGGSKCPDALIQRMEKVLGAEVQTSWGMTELSPLGTIATANSATASERASGRPPMGLDLKLTDGNGARLESQRGVTGHLWVKGASVVERYFKAETTALDHEGYFYTGDLAIIDEAGNLTINGRSKDLIKSGGEWINPAEIEEIVGRHPSVGQVAVIGRPDEKWGERPVLVVEAAAGKSLDSSMLIGLLHGKVAKWWIPDQVDQVSVMPLAATGKIDKNKLRAAYAQVADGSSQAGAT
jgi:acyl-CoA synthetase (AMP-forming)/AMP-acid ligase II